MFLLDKDQTRVEALMASLVHLHCWLDPKACKVHMMKDSLPEDTFIHTPSICRDYEEIYAVRGGLPHRGQWRLIEMSKVDPVNLTAIATARVSEKICDGHFGIVPGVLYAEACAQAFADLLLATVTSENNEEPLSVRLKKLGDCEFMEVAKPHEKLSVYVRWMRERLPDNSFKRAARHYGIAILTARSKPVFATPLCGLAFKQGSDLPVRV